MSVLGIMFRQAWAAGEAYGKAWCLTCIDQAAEYDVATPEQYQEVLGMLRQAVEGG